jgi:2-polyprenyl-3-methyl-5-hydroxy-6-metoxy-1,4-benzoquinol methylase
MPETDRCDCPGCPNVFTKRDAEDDAAQYRRSGPDRTTRTLLDAIRAEGIDGATLLDIGGGIGAIQIELLASGAASSESVEASPAFVEVARGEAERRGLAGRMVQREGDFVAMADEVGPADVVTLHRMVCCYSDMPRLLARSADHARRLVGLTYPRDTWWVHLVARIVNLTYRITRSRLRWYTHSEAAMDAIVRGLGFERHFLRRTFLWQVAVYARPE